MYSKLTQLHFISKLSSSSPAIQPPPALMSALGKTPFFHVQIQSAIKIVTFTHRRRALAFASPSEGTTSLINY